MQKTISVQINELQGMSVGELREKYEELFNETPRSRNKQNLIKRIAYRMQELLEGSLSERARKRAAELADEAHIHIRATPGTRGEDAPVKVPVPAKRDPRLPAAGTMLVREFGGKRHEVTIREQDILYAGKSYRSLSSVARAISGTPWNGFRFLRSHARKQNENIYRKHASAQALRHLYAKIHRSRARARLQLARCPARGLRAVHRKPRPCRMVSPARALRRWRLHRRQPGAPCLPEAHAGHRARQDRHRNHL